MFDAILDSVKGEVVEGLTSKLGLNSSEVDKTLSSTKEAFDTTISNEAKNNGVDTLVNLFSKEDNSDSSDNILKDLGGNLLSSLTSNGFSGDKASSITDMILPIVIKFAADKIGGDSSMISSLVSNSGLVDKASDMLKGMFN